MSFPPRMDADTLHRVSVALLSISGGLLFAAMQLIGAGISASDQFYAAGVSQALSPLGQSAAVGVVAFICAELASSPSTPEHGHPHSKANYLQTGAVLICVYGLFTLAWGGYLLLSNAVVAQP